MKVMGVDPGTLKMGVGVVEKKLNSMEAVFYTTLSVSNKVHLHERLRRLYDGVRDLIDKHQPDVIALEDVFFGVNVKAAIRIGEARCAVILAASQSGISVVEYLPTKVKSSVCGAGRAAKVQIQNMVKNILRLKEVPAPDAADALAIAICHVHNERFG